MVFFCVNGQSCGRCSAPEFGPPALIREPVSLSAALDALTSFPRCMRHISNGSQDSFSQLFVSMALKAVNSGSVEDVDELGLLSRCVLAPLERGGQRHDAKAAAVVKARIEQYDGVSRPAVPDLPKTTKKSNSVAPPGDKARIRNGL